MAQISTKARFLPDQLKDLISRFYGISIDNKVLPIHNPNVNTKNHENSNYFIEISGDNTDTLNIAHTFITNCIKNMYFPRSLKSRNFNFPQSVINSISFNTGNFLCKLPNDKYLCLRNMDTDEPESDQNGCKINIAVDNIKCATIPNLQYAAKDIDVIFNAFHKNIERWKWDYWFIVWIDQIIKHKDNNFVDVTIGYYDVKHDIANNHDSRQLQLLQLQNDILMFLTDHKFVVIRLDDDISEEQVQNKWETFWKTMRSESELVTMTLYNGYAVFKTKKEFGTESITKCEEWLLNEMKLISEYDIDDTDDAELLILGEQEEEDDEGDDDENLFVALEKEDKIIADEIEAEYEGRKVHKRYEYDEKLMKECTCPRLSEEEFEMEYDGDIGAVNIRRIKGVGRIMERALNGYGVDDIQSFYEKHDEPHIRELKGIKRVIQNVLTLLDK